MVQVRAKQASSRELLEIVRRLVAALSVPVIVNDRADIAIMGGAAGVHLGPDDLPVAAVRALAPRSFIIGASLGSGEELASARGADYVGIGPAFATPSKADAGPPLSFAMNTRYFAGADLLAFRLTTCTSSGPSYQVWPAANVMGAPPLTCITIEPSRT